MRLSVMVTFLPAALLITAGQPATAQVLYEEYFSGGATDLEWTSAWFDSVGNPLTPMDVDSIAFNPSGDGWVGVVTGDVETLGGLGLAYAGDFGLTNYSVEAEVYVELDAGWYNAIMTRIDTTGDIIRGYQLAANFNSMLGGERIVFRRYSSIPDDIEDLLEWQGSDIPGGAPTEDGWHTMKIEVEDNLFRLYWDRQELPGGPYPDDVIPSGPFGVYVFSFLGQSSTMVDDIVVRSLGTGIEDDGHELSIPRAFALEQNFPNPFNPSTVIPFTLEPVEGSDRQHVTLSIFDLRGREVRRLTDGEMGDGSHRIHWDGRDAAGHPVPSGVYLYTLRTGGERISRKMILTR